jgi:hypothetical protein
MYSAPTPAHMLLRPAILEPPDGRGREPAGVLAEQCDQGLVEIARRDALEIQDRDQHLEALRATRVGRQDRRPPAAGAPRSAKTASASAFRRCCRRLSRPRLPPCSAAIPTSSLTTPSHDFASKHRLHGLAQHYSSPHDQRQIAAFGRAMGESW